MNFGEHHNVFLRNKGTIVNSHREQGNVHPPREAHRAEHKILAGSAAGANSFSSQVINGPKPKISCTQSKKVGVGRLHVTDGTNW